MLLKRTTHATSLLPPILRLQILFRIGLCYSDLFKRCKGLVGDLLFFNYFSLSNVSLLLCSLRQPNKESIINSII